MSPRRALRDDVDLIASDHAELLRILAAEREALALHSERVERDLDALRSGLDVLTEAAASHARRLDAIDAALNGGSLRR